ncbi:MAG: BadF/BadG/BcrA/BcrD ATPase family protein [Bacteroidota bacterium]
MTAPLYIGLDGGGTKTSLLAGTDTALLPPPPPGPGSNPQRVGVSSTVEILTTLIDSVVAHQPHRRLAAVCVGLAGAGTPSVQHEVHTALLAARPAWAQAVLDIVPDTEIALEAAWGADSGVLVIAGTGSSVLARTQAGTLVRAGGWGYLLGDEGSGYALGLAGLRAVARAMDGGSPTPLTTMLAARYDLHDRAQLVEAIYRQAWPIQRAAPLVLEAAQDGDAEMQALVAAQAEALIEHVANLTQRHPSIQPRLALTGGLAKAPVYTAQFQRALAQRMPRWTLAVATNAPVVGALARARRLAHEQTS